MILTLIETLGAWNWVALGLLLLGIEILMPSTFLLWPGLSAIIVGIITLVLGVDSAIWPWQAQVVVFLGLSLAIAFFGRKLMSKREWNTSDNPTLNERGTQLLGKEIVLTEAISQGRGRAKIGDTTWLVSGDDMPEGSKVVVSGSDGSILLVSAA